MRKFKKTEEMPWYQTLDPNNWQVEAVLKDQPQWQLDFFKKNKHALKEYAKAPRHLRVDPTFCPTPRMHTWVNWLVLPIPPEGHPIIETWFLEACGALEEKFKDIPDLSC